MPLTIDPNIPDIIKKTLKSVVASEQGAADGLTTIFGIDNTRLTYGPTDNEYTRSMPINKGSGVWDVHACVQLSSDLILMYLSKYAQLYRRCRTRNRSRELPRSLKDRLILDDYPVHHVRGL